MLAMGQVMHGWSRAFHGHDAAAVDELAEGIARWRSTGARLTAGTCPDEHQSALRAAFDSATELESPSLRLRAANALSPALRDAGKSHEARDLLGDVYAAFNEGFGTADLVAARAELGLR